MVAIVVLLLASSFCLVYLWKVHRLTGLPATKKMKIVANDQASIANDIGRLSNYLYGCPVRYGRILVGFRDCEILYYFHVKIPKGVAIIPIDPFSGKPYYYQNNDNTYYLLSAGPNGIYDIEDGSDDIGFSSTLDFLK